MGLLGNIEHVLVSRHFIRWGLILSCSKRTVVGSIPQQRLTLCKKPSIRYCIFLRIFCVYHKYTKVSAYFKYPLVYFMNPRATIIQRIFITRSNNEFMQFMHVSFIVIISGAREFKWILSCWNVSCKGEIELRS